MVVVDVKWSMAGHSGENQGACFAEIAWKNGRGGQVVERGEDMFMFEQICGTRA